MEELRVSPERLLERLVALGEIGAIPETTGSSRLAFSDADKAGRDLVVTWFEDLGLDVMVDGIGNVVGLWSPKRTDRPLAPVMTGSHIDTVRTGGRVVLVGIPSADRTSFTASTARHKGLTMVVAHRMNPTLMHTAVELIEHGVVDLSGIISATYPLSRGAEAFDDAVDVRMAAVVLLADAGEDEHLVVHG